MARPIVLGNGRLHVGINRYGLVHDFYYPYVGTENHAAGKSLRHRVGVWCDGQLSWLDDGGWSFRFRYPHGALVGHTIAKNDSFGILLEFDDAVDAEETIFMRNIHVVNLRAETRDVRLFMHQAFVIGDVRSNTDTAQYLPDSDAILHYRGRRAFVVSGRYNDEPFDQYTTGLFGIEWHEGTYRDAEDGELSFNPVEHGRVDSTLRFRLDLDGHSSARVHYWIAAGNSTRSALLAHRKLQRDGIMPRLHKTARQWRKWLAPALDSIDSVPKPYRQTLLNSVMIVKSQIDSRGAVIASTDSSMLNYSRDAYAYCWPRDAAYALWPLIRLGYEEEARQFFVFAKTVLHPAGYLMHKYSADGALGSSWHPYVHDDGNVAPPIQEDETALVVFLFAQFYKISHDTALLDEYYESMIVPMADFMQNYVDPQTHLPRPSYDLWEEVFATTTYTTAVTYAALLAASELAEIRRDDARAVGWRAAAEDMYQAAQKHLFDSNNGRIRKGVSVRRGEIEYDATLDAASLYGSFMFGLFPIGSDMLERSISAFETRFSSNTMIGIPRYEDDQYLRHEGGPENLWIITSLWLAQYYNETAQHKKTEQILRWVIDHSEQPGILSEQISPLDGRPLSVSPLTWSHAEFISTLLDLTPPDSQERAS